MFHPNGPTFRELAVQALSSTEEGYNLLASKFDATPFRTPDLVLEAVALHIAPHRRALDLCCGTGAGMRMLQPLCEDEVVGLDFSQGMLEQARAGLEAEEGGATLRFVHGDVLNMSWAEEFDVITCFGALGHILLEDQARFFQAVYQALRPGGQFLFVTSQTPRATSRVFWLVHGFNAVMRIRNALRKPPFIMYYGTVMLPDCLALLDSAGFSTRHQPLSCSGALRQLHVVVASRI